ncbi:MAG: HTH-type transcriptional activator IlvY, partial [Desulfobulbaceae bacterium]|nr:HTH-type transcriptional activator IlvY [Desulfobulbaceae bacterium]
LLTMVSLGCGVGVAPRLVLEKSTLQDQLRVLDVRPQLAPFIIGACTFKKNLDNPLVAAFWATVGRQTAQGGA